MKIEKIIGGFMIVGAFMACDDMNSIHQEYLDRGEEIYIGIPDSLTVLPGNRRAIVEWKIDADPKLKECVVKWGEQDSIIFPINRTTNGSTWMSGEINGLPEGSLIFTAYTRDIYGNTSLRREKTQIIYGQKYIDEQSPRSIASIDVIGPDVLIMKWNTIENCVGVNMRYLARDNQMKDIFISSSQTEVELKDFILGGEFSYETLYKPLETCIDVFATAPLVLNFPNM